MQLHTSVPSSRGGAAPQWASAAAADDPWPGDVDGSVTARSWPQQEVVSAWVNGYEIVEVLRRELMCRWGSGAGGGWGCVPTRIPTACCWIAAMAY